MRRWLIKSRKDKNLTQQEVANEVGISRSYYSEIEKGVKNPSGKVALRIANFLKINPEKFFE